MFRAVSTNSFDDTLYCHFMDMKQVFIRTYSCRNIITITIAVDVVNIAIALDIHVLTVAKSTVVEAPS